MLGEADWRLTPEGRQLAGRETLANSIPRRALQAQVNAGVQQRMQWSGQLTQPGWREALNAALPINQLGQFRGAIEIATAAVEKFAKTLGWNPDQAVTRQAMGRRVGAAAY